MIGRLVALLVACSCVMAGPLDPPADVFSPGVGGNAEADPRIPIDPDPEAPKIIINAPGSYFLTGSIVGTAGNNGIEITANNVTLDLRGFGVIGIPGTLDGIVATTANRVNIRIHGGTIRGWGGDGIDLTNGLNSIVEDIQATSNTAHGVLASRATIRNVQARGNGASGIHVVGSSNIIACHTSANGAAGIQGNLGGATGVLVRDCIAELNAQDGILLGQGSSVLDSVADRNTLDGIQVGAGSVVARCAARSNADSGIKTVGGCVVTQRAAASNEGNGITADSGTVISQCSSTANLLDGVQASSSCTIVDSIVMGNSVRGIDCGVRSLISGNTCTSNGIEGIRIATTSRIVGNTCSSNFAGIIATGADNVIDSNHVVGNDTGIQVLAAGNAIFRNQASGNDTDFSIAGGNDTGPIGTVAASTSPWANIQF